MTTPICSFRRLKMSGSCWFPVEPGRATKNNFGPLDKRGPQNGFGVPFGLPPDQPQKDLRKLADPHVQPKNTQGKLTFGQKGEVCNKRVCHSFSGDLPKWRASVFWKPDLFLLFLTTAPKKTMYVFKQTTTKRCPRYPSKKKRHAPTGPSMAGLQGAPWRGSEGSR